MIELVLGRVVKRNGEIRDVTRRDAVVADYVRFLVEHNKNVPFRELPSALARYLNAIEQPDPFLGTVVPGNRLVYRGSAQEPLKRLRHARTSLTGARFAVL